MNIFSVVSQIFDSVKKDLETRETIFDYFTMSRSELVGKMGENRVNGNLERIKSFIEDGLVLTDVYIPKLNGETAQIDALYLTSRGIYVFEIKNYSGWIFGNDKSNYWTVCYKGGRRARLYNPIMQNASHIKWLKNIVGDTRCFSIVVFTDFCEFKNLNVANADAFVIKNSDLAECLIKIQEAVEPVYKKEDIDAFYDKLYPYAHVTKTEKKKHKEQVKEQLNTNTAKCPRCGGKLILRTAKSGYYAGKSFWGCSNYPGCKYIKNC